MAQVQPDYGSINDPSQMGSPGPKLRNPAGPMGCTRRSAFISTVILVIAVLLTVLITYHFTKSAIQAEYEDVNPLKPEEQRSDEIITAEELRLPNNIEPIHYNLTMKTYLPGYEVAPPATKNLTFEAQVIMTFKVTQTSRKIVVNFANLNIVHDECRVIVNNKPLKISRIEEIPKLEKLDFNLDESIEKDAMGELKIVYTGDISVDLKGFYQSAYYNRKNEKIIAAVSQMEPSDARRMVPCMDEPSFKANWTVTIVHPKGTTALSNGIDVSTQEHTEGFMKTRFATTPKMSTYLLAVLVSAFEKIEKKTKRGTLFRIWARPEAINTTQYALESGVKVLEFYEEFYGVPFPLEKQDMVAVPDFSAGAMENWGLVTYRETDLLYDPKIYSNEGKRRVAVVIAHELAHQWFGNLVTMRWWDNLWLNEGFATFVEYIGANHISGGDFQMDDYFIEAAQESAMEDDKVASSHPLSFTVAKVEDVTEAFDGISYEKGGSFVQMLSTVMGKKNFDKGISFYLKQHSYSNAAAEDLWAVLDEVLPNDVKGPGGNKLSVKEFANQWTKQMGYPVVTVNRLNSTTALLTQERFKPNKEAKEKAAYRDNQYGYKWDVPIWYMYGNDQTIRMAWLPRNQPLHLDLPKDTILIVNPDSRGFYRTNYNVSDWKTIAEMLNKDPESLPYRAKTRLLFDAYELANDDKLDFTVLFDLFSYIKKETNYFPASAVLANLNAIRNHYGSEPEKIHLEKFYKSLLDANYPEVSNLSYIENNYQNDSLFYKIGFDLRILFNYCQLEGADCNEQFQAIFKEKVLAKCSNKDQLSECAEIGGPLRRKVYCEGVKNNGNSVYKKMLQWYRNEQTNAEKDNILNGLTCSKDITNLKGLLMSALNRDDGLFRFQDVSHVFTAVGSNLIADEFMFKFMLQRWDQIYNSLIEDPTSLKWVIMTCTSGIRTENEIQQLKYFIKTAKNASKFSWITQALEEAELNVKWQNKYFDKLTKEFKDRMTTPSSS